MKHFYFSLMFQLKGIEICKDHMKSCNPLKFLKLNPLPLQPSFKFQQLHAVHLFLLVGNYTYSFKPKPMLYLHFFFLNMFKNLFFKIRFSNPQDVYLCCISKNYLHCWTLGNLNATSVPLASSNYVFHKTKKKQQLTKHPQSP